MLSRVERDNGLVIEKVRVPLGVVAIIYEARPNVTTDAAALTLKSGNACILRGSRMAAHTNRVLIDLVRAAVESSGLPVDAVQEMEADRDRLREFISQPGGGRRGDPARRRGAQALPARQLPHPGAGRRRRKQPRLRGRRPPTPTMAEAIAINAKIQRPGVCNSAETLLVHRDRPELMDAITAALRARGRRDRGRRGGVGDRVSRHEDGRAHGQLTGRGARPHRHLRHRPFGGDRDR